MEKHFYAKEVAQAELYELDFTSNGKAAELSCGHRFLNDLALFQGGSCYNNFWIILGPDGVPWAEGNSYLVSKVLDTGLAIDHKTLKKIAGDLAHFRNTLMKAGLDFNVSPFERLKRPIYFYNAYLNNQIMVDESGHRVCARRLGSAIGFYVWFKKQHSFACEYPLWVETVLEQPSYDDYGFERYMGKVRRDVGIRVPRKSGLDREIVDERMLTPLEAAEQLNLVKALVSIGWIEMTFAFLIALTTGARIQTVFTLRAIHVSGGDSASGYKKIKVGIGTSVDTKYGRQNVLWLPEWLRLEIEKYLNSPRYRQRAKLAEEQEPGFQYLFITKFGNPYYLSEADRKKKPQKNPPDGSAVRHFILDKLIPKMRDDGCDIKFAFHDLRATFSANLVEEKQVQIERGEISLDDALHYVKDRLAHSCIKTTMRYFERAKRLKLMTRAQTEFEEHLRSLISFPEAFENE